MIIVLKSRFILSLPAFKSDLTETKQWNFKKPMPDITEFMTNCSMPDSDIILTALFTLRKWTYTDS